MLLLSVVVVNVGKVPVPVGKAMSLKNVKSYIGFNVIVLGTVGFN